MLDKMCFPGKKKDEPKPETPAPEEENKGNLTKIVYHRCIYIFIIYMKAPK